MSKRELLALLRELADPERLERPRHYDRATAGLTFGGLVRRLEADFGALCESERDTQDSSEYRRVRVLADATICGTRIVVCVSKFGSLAEVCADNPGAFWLCPRVATAIIYGFGRHLAHRGFER